MPPKKGTALSDSHKAALAEGRREGKLVRDYLEALEAHRPKRGRRRTKESIAKRLGDIDTEMTAASPMKRVALVQERIDLERELEAGDKKVDISALEAGFVKAAAAYSQRKGISYAAWREVGVPAAILKQAGISRAG